MRLSSKKGLLVAILLHLFFFAVVAINFGISRWKKKSEYFVFQLEPKAVTTPLPQPHTLKEEKPALAGEAVRSPQEQAKIKPKTLISYSDFVKTQGKPKVQRKAIKAPKIKTTEITRDLAKTLAPQEPPLRVSSNEQRILDSYVLRLKEKIDLVWEKPDQHAQTNSATIVAFRVNAIGRIDNVQIIESSGSSHFDESVLNAFARTPHVAPPPEKEAFTFQLTFRMISG